MSIWICYESKLLIAFGLWILSCKCDKDVTELIVEKQLIPEDCGTFADSGDEVAVHYTGMLLSGAVFDTSRQPNRQPLEFKLGEGKVIPGWEHGIKGMCVGEKRKLTIPPHLGYGAQGYPPAIPPNSVLIFETELVGLRKPEMDLAYVMELVRFLSIPAVVIYVAYYFYQRYQTEAEEKKKEKKERKKRR